MEQVNHKVDGVSLNATKFAGMKKEDAVKEMVVGNILKTHNKDEAWAAKAHDACVDAVKQAEKKAKEEAAKKK
jgi:hypothetical protein